MAKDKATPEQKNNLLTNGLYLLMDEINTDSCRACIQCYLPEPSSWPQLHFR